MVELKMFFISIVVVGISVAALSIKLLLKKNGAFPNTSISKNPAIRKRGILCANTQDKIANRKKCETCEKTYNNIIIRS